MYLLPCFRQHLSVVLHDDKGFLYSLILYATCPYQAGFPANFDHSFPTPTVATTSDNVCKAILWRLTGMLQHVSR